jgi:hypothetical protein
MALEKLTAAYLSSAALMLRLKRSMKAALAPWHPRARERATAAQPSSLASVASPRLNPAFLTMFPRTFGSPPQ